uniref:Uncharacterized protein n=1 Tax=Oryza meridionalis TaxID=40149 RepID=A0A0E0E2J5_9ORYZ
MTVKNCTILKCYHQQHLVDPSNQYHLTMTERDNNSTLPKSRSHRAGNRSERARFTDTSRWARGEEDRTTNLRLGGHTPVSRGRRGSAGEQRAKRHAGVAVVPRSFEP